MERTATKVTILEFTAHGWRPVRTVYCGEGKSLISTLRAKQRRSLKQSNAKSASFWGCCISVMVVCVLLAPIFF